DPVPPPGPQPTPSPGGGSPQPPQPGPGPLPPQPTPGGGAPKPVVKNFHGSVEVSASMAKMKLAQIADELINILSSDPDATVKVNLEISAEFPSGASENIKRAVSENASSLSFKTKEWSEH